MKIEDIIKLIELTDGQRVIELTESHKKGLRDEIKAGMEVNAEMIRQRRIELLKQAQEHAMEKLEHYLKLKLKEE